RHSQPRSRRHDARAPWRAERKNHSRRCGRLLARRGPPALPGSTVPAAESCALSSPAVSHSTKELRRASDVRIDIRRSPAPKFQRGRPSALFDGGGRRFFQDQATLRARLRSQFAKPVLFLTKSRYNPAWQKEAVNRGQNWLFNRSNRPFSGRL